MKKEKIIGFDVDGVLVKKKITSEDIEDILKEIKENLKEINAVELLSIAAESPLVLELLKKEGKIKVEELERAKAEGIKLVEEINEVNYPSLTKFLLNSRWWRNLLEKAEPTENIEVLKEISGEKHAISRRLVSDLETMVRFFKKNNIEIPRENIHLRPDLSISEIEHKKNIIQKYGIQVFYDDLERIVKEIPQARIFKGWPQVKEDLGI